MGLAIRSQVWEFSQVNWTLLLLAHGTIERLEEVPAFLQEIRRGRPPSPELVEQMCARYRHVGGSPLLENTQAQADALSRLSKIPTRVAMRLWNPRVGEVLASDPPENVCLVPLAPFSVTVYEQAARAEVASLAAPPSLACVQPFGDSDQFVEACASHLEEHGGKALADGASLVLTAHSLPQIVIDRGDRYQLEFEACARRIEQRLGRSASIAYQSQGADGGHWLGPTLLGTLQKLSQQGVRQVVVAPVGFLSEHIETLYDLDVETRLHCQALNLELCRVPALGTHPLLIEALWQAAQAAIATWKSTNLTAGGPDLS